MLQAQALPVGSALPAFELMERGSITRLHFQAHTAGAASVSVDSAGSLHLHMMCVPCLQLLREASWGVALVTKRSADLQAGCRQQ